MLKTCCSICKTTNLIDVLDLGMHPCADLFVNDTDKQNGIADKVWPLIICECKSCGHIQTKYKISQDTRYKEYEYSFVSSHSKSYCDYWDRFAIDNIVPGENVLEIGCNDGYLLNACKKIGCKILGIDPSPNMVSLAKQRGLDVICGYFEQTEIKQKTYDVIIANNVVNHIDDLETCMNAVKKSLKKEGRFIVQIPDCDWMFRSNMFDQIYHEHVHYFTEKSLTNLASLYGFEVKKIQHVDFHGKSLLVTMKIDSKYKKSFTNHCNEFDFDSLSNFIQTKRRNVISKINDTLINGRKIVTLGASAKGNTFLNYIGLTSKDIECVLEVSSLKLNKFTPLSRIKICSEDKIKEFRDPLVLVTTWNLPMHVQEKLLSINPTIEFYNP